MSWRQRANRALLLFEGSSNDQEDRTWQIFNHILNESNRDDYISRDFYNVQQTAGGLPAGVTFEQFLAAVTGHVRTELNSSSFAAELGDDEFRTAALTFDDSIRRHIRFLNGIVHQSPPGRVHRDLWELILRARNDPKSIYSCYRDYLVDA